MWSDQIKDKSTKRQVPFFMVITLVVAGQTTIHAEQVAFQLEDRPLVQLVEDKVIQTKRILEWGFPMSNQQLGYCPENGEVSIELDFEWSKSDCPTWPPFKGEWYQPQSQPRGSAWNGFSIASNKPYTFGIVKI